MKSHKASKCRTEPQWNQDDADIESRQALLSALDIAVIIPCYNEEQTIADVVQAFSRELPNQRIYVYDNNSTDRTIESARQAGAIVKQEVLQGKGQVVRRMFADVDADVYILVDGDGTYDASSVYKLIETLVQGPYDMVNAARQASHANAYRKGHEFGNKLLTSLVSILFGNYFTDMLSGYRSFSRRFVKSFPALSTGFEIETEFAIHALELRMPVMEISTPYQERQEGSYSKLNTIRDGFRILKTIFYFLQEEKPLKFFSVFAGGLSLLSLFLAWPLFTTYFATGLVPRFPTSILCTGLMILAVLSFLCGLILDSVALGRREQKRMRYLQIPAPQMGKDGPT